MLEQAGELQANTTCAPRLAIVRDFREERWYSMDLVADMLVENLKTRYATEFRPEDLCPQFHRYCMRVPSLGERKFAYNADRILNRFCKYPGWLRAQARDFSLFHIIDHSYAHLVHALPQKRTVVTCHDVDSFHILLLAGWSPRLQIMRAMARRILSGLRLAERVICDSAATRDELLAHDWVRPERIAVIPLGVDSVFSPAPDAMADAELARILGPASSRLKLLHVGSTIPRKGIHVLLRAFAKIKKSFPEVILLRVGGPFTSAQADLLKELQINTSVIVLPFLERAVLAAAYRSAALTLLPSEREGFGFPVLESMASGTPVVASDISVLREVGGDVASYCPVDDIEAFSTQACAVLRELQDPSANCRSRDACILQARKYSWSEYTAKTVGVYRQVMSPLQPAGSAV